MMTPCPRIEASFAMETGLVETLHATASVFDLADVGVVAFDEAGEVVFENATGATWRTRQAEAIEIEPSESRESTELVQRIGEISAALYDLSGESDFPFAADERRDPKVVLRILDGDAATVAVTHPGHGDTRVEAALSAL